MSYLIGIDLGTTNCSVTAVDSIGNLNVIKNRDNEYITPSAVYFNKIPNSYIIGKRAKEKAATDPKNLVTLVKREMGKLKEEVRYSKLDRKYMPYVYWNRTFSPEEISSKILSQLKKDAEMILDQEIKEAVITCPAYFGQQQKEATRQAGVLAGLDVLEVIPEPTAACLTYGTKSTKDKEKIFVFDLGGGTFDITIVDSSIGEYGKVIEVKSCGGDSKLGGADWDYYLLDFMLREFKNKHYIDLSYEKGEEKDIAYGKLTLDVEQAKKELSKPGVTETSITINYGGASFTKTITREDYARITEPLTEQCHTYCENLLKKNNMTWNDIDTILMVGSMSNCVTVQDALKKWCGKDVNFGVVNPKTCVSEGAAIRAYQKVCEREGKKTAVKTTAEVMKYDSEDSEVLAQIEQKVVSAEKVTTVIESAKSVLPSSIRIKLHSKSLNKYVAHEFLKKDSPYPNQKVQSFPISSPEQQAITVLVLEGESDELDQCSELGNVVVPLEGDHTNQDRIEVTLSVDGNGILQVGAKDLKTGKTVSAKIERKNALSDEEIKQVQENAANDDFEL